jgi:hypothetical protein
VTEEELEKVTMKELIQILLLVWKEQGLKIAIKTCSVLWHRRRKWTTAKAARN